MDGFLIIVECWSKYRNRQRNQFKRFLLMSDSFSCGNDKMIAVNPRYLLNIFLIFGHFEMFPFPSNFDLRSYKKRVNISISMRGK
jgi:hypothetical protein